MHQLLRTEGCRNATGQRHPINQPINQSTNQLNFEARGIEILVPDILNQHQLIVQKILPLF
jgi:hypothetical protein